MSPLIFQRAISPVSAVARERLDGAIAKLSAEDPNLEFETHTLFLFFSRVFIRGTDERQIEAAVERILGEFHVELVGGDAAVLPVYRVAFTHVACGEVKRATQNKGRGRYAHVKVRLLPTAHGSGFVFQNEIVGGSIPTEFIKPIEDGVRAALPREPVGWPVDACVELYDGSYHDIDSTAEAFKAAGSAAFFDAMKKAKPVLLEPVVRVTLEEGAHVPPALMPLSDVLRRSTPVMRATWVIAFDHFAPKSEPDDDDKDRWSNVGARIRPSPTRNQPSVALPEPDNC